MSVSLSRADLVADEEVLALLLEALIERNKLDPFGVIVDGFPRSPVQAHCIPLLFDCIRELRRVYYDGKGDARFRRPIFHITVRTASMHHASEAQIFVCLPPRC